jgi:hypothetical protein
VSGYGYYTGSCCSLRSFLSPHLSQLLVTTTVSGCSFVKPTNLNWFACAFLTKLPAWLSFPERSVFGFQSPRRNDGSGVFGCSEDQLSTCSFSKSYDFSKLATSNSINNSPLCRSMIPCMQGSKRSNLLSRMLF